MWIKRGGGKVNRVTLKSLHVPHSRGWRRVYLSNVFSRKFLVGTNNGVGWRPSAKISQLIFAVFLRNIYPRASIAIANDPWWKIMNRDEFRCSLRGQFMHCLQLCGVTSRVCSCDMAHDLFEYCELVVCVGLVIAIVYHI